jgi:hypothetical protein
MALLPKEPTTRACHSNKLNRGVAWGLILGSVMDIETSCRDCIRRPDACHWPMPELVAQGACLELRGPLLP